MHIPCPFCGDRAAEEFEVRGGDPGPRPDPNAPDAAAEFNAYVYLRDNPEGVHNERWYHAAGCRRWLSVRRDTRTHAVLSVTLAAP